MPRGVGFDLLQSFRADDFHAFETVGVAATVQFFQTRQFGFAGGDDDLAADFIGDVVGVAKCHQLCAAADAASRFQRSRPIVKSGMDDAAVVAGLVARQLRLLSPGAIAGYWDGPR